MFPGVVSAPIDSHCQGCDVFDLCSVSKWVSELFSQLCEITVCSHLGFVSIVPRPLSCFGWLNLHR